MNRPSLLIAALLLTGCATQQSILAPYADVPTDCAAIDAELQSLAAKDATTINIRTARDVGVLGVSVATAVGSIPAAWVGVPIAVTLIHAVSFGTNSTRIAYLAYQRGYRGCRGL